MRTVVKTYKFQLYNSKKNKYLHDSIDIAAQIWNYCIAMHRIYYKLYKKHIPLYRLLKHITKTKKRTKYMHWRNLGSQAIQDVAERVERSYEAFFKHCKQKRYGKKSLPHFCKQARYKSFTLKQSGYFFHDENKITIMGRDYKYWASRPIEGTIKTLTVKRNTLGELYIFVVVKQECSEVIPRAGKAAGLDFGLIHFLNFDDGKRIDSPLWYKAALSELQTAHRAVSRCVKGSNNRRRAIQHLDRVYAKVSNRRRDWFFKLAHQLVSEYAIICIEDLNLDAMKRLWGRKVSDLAFAEFVSFLEWIASNAGVAVVKVDRWLPSSKACHCCGSINAGLGLQQRSWTCPYCGAHLDRDVNAAINIKNAGLALIGCPAM